MSRKSEQEEGSKMNEKKSSVADSLLQDCCFAGYVNPFIETETR